MSGDRSGAWQCRRFLVAMARGFGRDSHARPARPSGDFDAVILSLLFVRVVRCLLRKRGAWLCLLGGGRVIACFLCKLSGYSVSWRSLWLGPAARCAGGGTSPMGDTGADAGVCGIGAGVVDSAGSLSGRATVARSCVQHCRGLPASSCFCSSFCLHSFWQAVVLSSVLGVCAHWQGVLTMGLTSESLGRLGHVQQNNGENTVVPARMLSSSCSMSSTRRRFSRGTRMPSSSWLSSSSSELLLQLRSSLAVEGVFSLLPSCRSVVPSSLPQPHALCVHCSCSRCSLSWLPGGSSPDACGSVAMLVLPRFLWWCCGGVGQPTLLFVLQK